MRRDEYELFYSSDTRLARGFESALTVHTGVRVLFYEKDERGVHRRQRFPSS